MPSLVLVRHAHVTQEPSVPVEQWSLSPAGVRSAGRLADHAALREVAVLYTSPEPKAVATAALIAGQAAGRRPIVQVSDLRELDRSAAGWVGDEAAYRAMVEEVLLRPGESVRGCEPAGEAQARMVRAVEGLVAAHPTGAIAVVSHGLVLTLYLSHLLGLATPDPAIWRGIGFPDLAVVDPAAARIVAGFRGRGGW